MKSITTFLLLGLLLSANHMPFPHTAQERIRSGARKGLDMLTLARSYPRPALPDTGYATAFTEFSEQRFLAKRSEDVAPWRKIGPANIGGRTLALAINPDNPDIIWAGSASGGLWRSTSAGLGPEPWQRVETGFPTTSISSIALAPDNPEVIFIGTGEVYGSAESFPGIGRRITRGSYGIGILKSSDGGLTWSKSLDWQYNQRRGVQDIAFNPLNANTIWAATTEGTYRSRDGGATWQKVHDVVMATSVVISAQDTNIVNIACGGMGSPGHGLYRSSDGGATWQKADLAALGIDSFLGKAVLAQAVTAPNIVYASIGNSNGDFSREFGTWLLRSDDSGATWRIVNTLDYARYQGWYSHYVGVSPFDAGFVACGGVQFYLSRDGGQTLEETSGTINNFKNPNWLHVDHHDIAFHPNDSLTFYLASDGGVYRTTDGGATFEHCNTGYQTSQFYAGFSSSVLDSNLAMGGMQDNFTAIYEGKPEWRRVIGGDGGWTAMNQSENDILFGSSQYLRIYKSIDRGLSWKRLSLPRGWESNFIAPFLLSTADNRTMYAGASAVFRSDDAGETWTVTNNGTLLDRGNPVIAMAGSATDARVVYIATSPLYARSSVFITRDGGESWQQSSGGLPDRFPTDLFVDPTNHDIAYLTFGGFGSSHLFRTTNGGITWVAIDAGVPDVPAWSVMLDPDDTRIIYLGNDLGVFASRDAGETWQPWSEGLPDAVFAMDLSGSPANTSLRVATHGNGVYERPLLSTLPADTPVEVPTEITLLQNYPNPFSQIAGTTFRFYLPQAEFVSLRIFDLRGRELATLIDQNLPRGWRQINWDGRDNNGLRVGSGVYFFTLRVNATTHRGKLTILR